MTLEAGAVEMAEFAEYLQAHVGQLVVDETGLEGRFDIRVTFKPDPALSLLPPFPGGQSGEGPSLFVALQELGLTLVSRRGAVEVLVVDQIEPLTPN